MAARNPARPLFVPAYGVSNYVDVAVAMKERLGPAGFEIVGAQVLPPNQHTAPGCFVSAVLPDFVSGGRAGLQCPRPRGRPCVVRILMQTSCTGDARMRRPRCRTELGAAYKVHLSVCASKVILALFSDLRLVVVVACVENPHANAYGKTGKQEEDSAFNWFESHQDLAAVLLCRQVTHTGRAPSKMLV